MKSRSDVEPFWYLEKDQHKLCRSAKQYVREVGDLTIVFWSKDTIYVIGKWQKLMITRWNDTMGTYRRWFNMSRALKRRQNITMGDVYAIAKKYDFQLKGLRYTPPALDGITKIKEYEW